MDQPPTPARRGGALVASISIPLALVAGLIGLVGGVIVAVVVFVVVLAAVAAWVWVGADNRVRRAMGGRPADRRSEARPLNLIEGLSFTAGLHPPQLVVVDEDALNIAAFGREQSSATVVATAGLLQELTRIELEGILAAALVEIRAGQLGPATIAASLPGLGRRLVSSAVGRDAATDQAAVGLTRFPPGLASALDKMAAKGTATAIGGPDRAHLWLADPAPAGQGSPGRTPVADRAEALREL